MDLFLYVLIMFMQFFFATGDTILCYLCHQTSKECNNGLVNYIHQKNCTEGECVTMKYETPMPGSNVLATIRDCATHSAPELLEKSSRYSKKRARIIYYKTCSEPLCNGGSRIRVNTV